MTPVCDVPKKQCVSCTDGIKNGNETDVDCGGPDCGACLGQPCDPQNGCGNKSFCSLQDNLCCSTVCGEKCEACASAKTGQPDGTCAPIPYTMDPDGECSALGGCGQAPNKCRCEDGMKNNDESDVDCGGAACARCSGGKTCGMDNDCAADVSVCVSGACCNSTCGLPCSQCNAVGQCVFVPGGFDDAFCSASGKTCGANGAGCVGKAGAACTSGSQCLSGVCQASKCAKSTLNGSCSNDMDCATGTCQSYFCSL